MSGYAGAAGSWRWPPRVNGLQDDLPHILTTFKMWGSGGLKWTSTGEITVDVLVYELAVTPRSARFPEWVRIETADGHPPGGNGIA